MACGCKNKQNNTASQAVQKPSNPLNNGSVGGKRIEKRIIRLFFLKNLVFQKNFHIFALRIG
jgi:hypothetical protein